jgi:hypothetical protein
MRRKAYGEYVAVHRGHRLPFTFESTDASESPVHPSASWSLRRIGTGRRSTRGQRSATVVRTAEFSRRLSQLCETKPICPKRGRQEVRSRPVAAEPSLKRRADLGQNAPNKPNYRGFSAENAGRREKQSRSTPQGVEAEYRRAPCAASCAKQTRGPGLNANLRHSVQNKPNYHGPWAENAGRRRKQTQFTPKEVEAMLGQHKPQSDRCRDSFRACFRVDGAAAGAVDCGSAFSTCGSVGAYEMRETLLGRSISPFAGHIFGGTRS